MHLTGALGRGAFGRGALGRPVGRCSRLAHLAEMHLAGRHAPGRGAFGRDALGRPVGRCTRLGHLAEMHLAGKHTLSRGAFGRDALGRQTYTWQRGIWHRCIRQATWQVHLSRPFGKDQMSYHSGSLVQS
eukprot:210813-Pelagomonas_calceolata.AAC.1